MSSPHALQETAVVGNNNGSATSNGGPSDNTCVYMGLGCCYTGFDTDNIMLLAKADAEITCLTSETCLAANHDHLGIGILPPSHHTKDECCKIGLFCVTFGCKQPKLCCQGVAQVLCVTQVLSLPMNASYIAAPIGAICCFQFAPKNGCLASAPFCPAMTDIKNVCTPINQVMAR